MRLRRRFWQLRNLWERFAPHILKPITEFLVPVERLLRAVVAACIRIVIFVFLGLLFGFALIYSREYISYLQESLPDVEILKTYKPDVVTTVQDRNGQTITEFFLERRIPMTADEIPKVFIQALISAEDKNFFSHGGIDYYSIARAFLKNIGASIANGKWHTVQGGSTLTQQLARQIFLDPKERTLKRKVLEARLAWKIERMFSKKDILTFYCNQVYFGHGQYGCTAAADYYLGKELRDVTVEEAALLVGLLSSPAEFSPLKHPEKAKVRRDEILRRMHVNGYIQTEKEYKAHTEIPIRLFRAQKETITPHALEWIKDILETEELSYNDIWRSGLLIRTTLDSRYQKILNTAFDEGLREYEMRHQQNPYNPIEGAGILIELQTGNIVAYYGGRDFEKNKFDHARQARRQPGSTFKTFVLAAALEKELWTLDSMVRDEKSCYGTRSKPYCPENFALERPRYAGWIPAKRAFEESRNAAFVWLAYKTGIKRVADLGERFGFLRIEPVLSSAIGSSEATLLELTGAYSVFANKGMLIEPHIIQEIDTDDGKQKKPLRENTSKRVLSESLSAEMIKALRGVVLHGTGRRARDIGFQVAGKTGTTSRPNSENGKRDDTIDAWFCGFTSEHALCVWVGFDTPEDLGKNETGASSALPIFIKTLKGIYKDRVPDDLLDEPLFPAAFKKKEEPKEIMPENPSESKEVSKEEIKSP